MTPEFDLFHTTLDHRKLLIEAGAGTGKTFSLTGIILRLLIEQDIPLPQILIVTYTEAATAELRQRIRALLVDLETDLAGKAKATDPLAARFATYLRENAITEKALRNLRTALSEFDQAAVFTIHGFCARMLTDNAFASREPLEAGSLVTEEELAREVADDYWRKTFLQSHHPALLDWYRFAKYDSPAKLATLLQNNTSTAANSHEEIPHDSAFRRMETLVRQLADIVQEEAAALRAIFTCGALKRTSYNDSRIHHILTFFLELPQSPSPLLRVLRFTRGPNRKNDGLRFITSSNLQKAIKKNQQIDYNHAAFRIAEELDQLLQSSGDTIKADFLQWALPQLEKIKRIRNVMTFHDMLERMNRAVTQPDLKAALRKRFRAGLIDEFQDTDPLQLEIFTTLFHGDQHLLICVGDPKQSIYSFRGADLQCYLQARDQKDFRLVALRTNYRSEPEVVEAVNQLFTSSPQSPFGQDIPFEPATLPKDKPLRGAPKDPPFRFRCFPSVPTQPEVAEAVVHEIHFLLNRLQSRSYRAIAVLVHTHDQAQSIARRLQTAAIPYLRRVDRNVFQTEAAILLRIAMEGILNPARPDALKAALLTPLFGYQADQIAALESDSRKLEDVIGMIDRLRGLWIDYGFMSAFQAVLAQFTVRQRLLAVSGGEEALAFYLQLAELLHRSEQKDRRSPHSLIQWLSDQIQGSTDLDSNESRIRRPSDADAVIISTIHASKGLQYDAVVLPFLWKDPRTPHPGEEVRKLYVALTRARKAVTAFLPNVKPKKNPKSALIPLLQNATGASEPGEAATIMADQSHGFIGFSIGSAPKRDFQKPDVQPALEYRYPPASPPPPSRINSFSALTRHQQDLSAIAEDPFAEQREDTQSPGLTAPADTQPTDPLPKGSAMGTALHHILEQVDFTKPGDPTIIIKDALRREGFDSTDLVQTISQRIPVWLQTPLYPEDGFSLSAIANSHRLNELEFHLPVQAVSPQEFADAIAEDEPVPGFAQDLLKASPQSLQGFLTGYIDLVFQYKSQFFILDWKSNYLGPDPSHYNDHTIARSMREHLYPLQYLLYTVALDAWLSRRLPDYQYDRAFGGVCYAYLRGFGNIPGKSVFHARPAATTIHNLRSLLIPHSP